MKNGGFRWKIFCQWWIVHWEVWWPEGTTGAFTVANPRLAVFPKRGGRWNCKEDSYPNSPKPSPTWPYKACSNNPQWVGLYPIVSHFFHNCLNPVLFGYKLYPSYISTFPRGHLGVPEDVHIKSGQEHAFFSEMDFEMLMRREVGHGVMR